MIDGALFERAKEVLEACERAALRVALAESCTGGLLAGSLTAVPGSSKVVERGFVTYSNEAKADILGVPAEIIAREGAVSAPVARAMAEGALARSLAELSAAITGVAGPDGGSEAKPVGLVFIACARRGRPTLVERYIFTGDRGAIRRASVEAALSLLLRQVK
ncbi:MAG: nicotinamide-nucleotide amidohydrolase family protein [Alphaproteobacteria bacterium]